MGKVLLGILLWTILVFVPLPTMARTFVNISIGLPPPIVYAAPPELVVLPGTYVYVAPDVTEEIFFYRGWWWRPWGGHWYRSRSYSSGWAYYRHVPSFYRGIPSGWRNDYREHRWHGHAWDYQRIPHQQLHQNWRSWERSRHWERQQHWGVPELRPQTRSLRPSREIQPHQLRPQERRDVRSGDFRSEQSQHHGNRDRGQEIQHQRGSRSQPSSQEMRSQPQTREGKQQGRSHQRHGSPEHGGEEQQGRR